MRNPSITLQYWCNMQTGYSPAKAAALGSDISVQAALAAVANSEFSAPVQLDGAAIKAAWPNPLATKVRAGIKMPTGVAVAKFVSGTTTLEGYNSNLVSAELHHGLAVSTQSIATGERADITQYLMGPYGNPLLNTGLAYKDDLNGDIYDVPPSVLSSINGEGRESKVSATGLTLDAQFPYHQKTSYVLDALGPVTGSVMTAHGVMPSSQMVNNAELSNLSPDWLLPAGTGDAFISTQASMLAKFGILLDPRAMDNEFDRNNDLYIIISSPASSSFCAPDLIWSRGSYSCPNNTPTLTSWGAYYGCTDVVIIPLTYLKRVRTYEQQFEYPADVAGVAEDLVLDRIIGTSTRVTTAVTNGVKFALGDKPALPLYWQTVIPTATGLIGPF